MVSTAPFRFPPLNTEQQIIRASASSPPRQARQRSSALSIIAAASPAADAAHPARLADCPASWNGSVRRISSSLPLHHQLRRVEPELLGGFLDGVALVGRLDGADPLPVGTELIDGPRRLRWFRWLGLLRHAGSIGRQLYTFNAGDRDGATGSTAGAPAL